MELDLIPRFDIRDFNRECEDEFEMDEIPTHGDQECVAWLDWSDLGRYPNVKEYLTRTYGKTIQKYNRIAIVPT